MNKPTFYVNSATGLSLGRLENIGWDNLMAANGETSFSKVRDKVGDECIDIAGTIAIRTRIEQSAGVAKRQANRLMKEIERAGFMKLLNGTPISCVSSVDAWAEVHQARARENRTANLPQQ